jgi:hypothetical protein
VNRHCSLWLQIAHFLVEIATYILPARQRDWSDAMRNELAYISSDANAVKWALGCILASMNERLNSMNKSRHPISRPVLMLEWLMCFGPLTLLWIAATRYVLTQNPVPVDIVLGTAIASLGPIALTAAMFVTARGSSSALRRLFQALAIVFGVTLTMQMLNIGKPRELNLSWWEFDLGVVVLSTILPLVACVHLAFLSRPTREAPELLDL